MTINAQKIDLDCAKMQDTVRELIEYNLPNYVKELSAGAADRAWNDFCFPTQETILEQTLPEEPSAALKNTIFLPWFYFHGLPEFNYKPIAQGLLENNEQVLDEYREHIIKALDNAYYSFYVILEVFPGWALKLKDILLGTEVIVKGMLVTKKLTPGDIIYSIILTLDSLSICVATAPFIVPASYHYQLITFRRALEYDYGADLEEVDLIYYDSKIRSFFLELIAIIFGLPYEQKKYLDCTVKFKLKCSPQLALEKLQPLTNIKYVCDIVRFSNKNKKWVY